MPDIRHTLQLLYTEKFEDLIFYFSNEFSLNLKTLYVHLFIQIDF